MKTNIFFKHTYYFISADTVSITKIDSDQKRQECWNVRLHCSTIIPRTIRWKDRTVERTSVENDKFFFDLKNLPNR